MWVFTSKRVRGQGARPPYVDFKIGAVSIATIVMTSGQKGGPWTYYLDTNEPPPYPTFNSFGEALTELHRLLNSTAPEGYETK